MKTFVISLFPLLLGLSTPVLPLHQAAISPRRAASSYVKASLPTTIDLNPVQESDIRSYYSALEGKDYSGNDLLIHLKDILKEGQLHFSYDVSSGVDIWKAYEITDRDWALSPASEITSGTYDPSTNVITGYVYGKSYSDPGQNPYVHPLYRDDDDASGRIRAWDAHSTKDGVNGIDREHVWPKSRGFDDTESGKVGARGDLHHLMAGDHVVNSNFHNNLPYAFVDLSKTYKDAGDSYSYAKGNYTGKAKSIESTQTVFEPRDEDKGDIARACFYMAARYNNLANNDDAIDSGNPNLVIDENLSTATESSTATQAVSLGLLRDLVAWHHLDPVDEYEKTRNDILYRNFSKNRNPFIDFPSWVDAIWGEATLAEDNRSVASFDPNPKGVAKPSVDNIYNLAPAKPIVSIEISSPKTEFTVGDAFSFGGKVTGTDEDGVKKDVTSQCSFSGYDMKKEGEQTVTVTHTPSGLTKTYAIKVAPAPKIPLPVLIGIAAAAVIVVIIVVLILAKGSKKQKKAVKSVIKSAVKGSSSSKKESASKSKKKSKL